MPIEIKELHIKINVDESSTTSTTGETSKQKEMDRMIAMCVEQVMEIISKKQER